SGMTGHILLTGLACWAPQAMPAAKRPARVANAMRPMLRFMSRSYSLWLLVLRRWRRWGFLLAVSSPQSAVRPGTGLVPLERSRPPDCGLRTACDRTTDVRYSGA